MTRITAAKLHHTVNPSISSSSLIHTSSFFLHNSNLRLPLSKRFKTLSLHSHSTSSSPPSVSSECTTSVGSPPLLTIRFSQRHVFFLNVLAVSVAVSASWLFLSAIPALLAFKRAAESLEKLMDETREELPHTMAAIRLSGMEISDLTMELSDLGQEITQGVRRSTNAVRVAEESLRGFTNKASPAPLQRVTSLPGETRLPEVAMSARSMKEGIVKSRAVLQMFFSLTRFSRMFLNYLAKRANR